MKWPSFFTLIRHDISEYNRLKYLKKADPTYQQFLSAFSVNPLDEKTKVLAREVTEKFALQCGDHNTPLADEESQRAKITGEKLKEIISLPEVIFVSPYDRTLATLRALICGWPELAEVKTYEEERIREQEHGLALLYSDWRIFHVLYPEQAKLYEIEGRYWYRYPQGENVPDVRLRLRSWMETLVRDFAEKNVLAITHHLSILALRANLERLAAEEFIRLDEQEKPINCGVTLYRGIPDEGRNGRLKLEFYNRRLF